MQFIYSTDNAAEAHMISHMLEENGIMAQVTGEFLQSGMGEIASHNCIKVLVIDEEFERATELIEGWEGLCRTNNKKIKKIPKAVLYIFIVITMWFLLRMFLTEITPFFITGESLPLGQRL